MTDLDFDQTLGAWMAHELERSPVLATRLGADGQHGELDDLSAGAIANNARADTSWRERLESVDESTLSPAQRVDRDAVIARLRGREILQSWEGWRRDPTIYLDPCFEGILMLMLHRIFPEGELARYTASRLRAVPTVLEQARLNLDAELASPVIVGRSAAQCRAAVGYVGDSLPGEFGQQNDRQLVAEAGRLAADAYRAFGDFLADLAARAKGSHAIGEQRYSALLNERELLSYGAEEVRRRGRRAFAELDDEMNEVAREVDPSTPNWRPVFEGSSADHAADFDELRRRYAEETAKARAFLAEHDLVSFAEGEACRVEPTPQVVRPILAVASYEEPPAFRPGLVGRFNVPWPPEGASEEEMQARLADNSLQSIPTITVHEAYPGHHWHLTWMKSTRRPVRFFVHSSYFAEGWALYAEKMMREEGYFTSGTALLGHLQARIFRAGRMVVDPGLHIGDMSFDEAVRYMHEQVGLTEPVARAEVGRYCTWPTQAPSYLTGSLEIERIRARFFKERGGGLRTFHDVIAGTGALPLGLAERAVFEGG